MRLRMRAQGLDFRAGLAHVLVLFPLGALVAWWAFDDGGYNPVDWQPGALLLLPLAAIVVCTPSLRWRRRPTRRLQVALGAFALYTAWSYASVSWAGDPGTALEGAHRCLLYLAAMVIVGLSGLSPGVLRGAVATIAGLIGLAAVVTIARIWGADGPDGLFLDGRLYAPLGYANADAAFWTTGALIGCVAGSGRDMPAVLRPPLLGLAALEVGLAVMTASRGWLFTLPLVLLLVLALTPGRVRFVLAALIVGLAVVPVLGALVAPVGAGGGRSLEEGAADTIRAAHDAIGPLVVVSVAALAAGIAWVVVDRRVILDSGARRVVSRTAGVLAVVVAAGGTIALFSVVPQPGDRLERAWQEFKAGETSRQSGAERLFSTGSGRYDIWRVAADLTADHPVVGVGQDNFAQPYVARRAVDYDEPRWVHSLPLRALAHTGIIGAILLAVALAALAAAAIRVRGRPNDRATAAPALVPLVVWSAHGSVDWLWEYPVLSVIALGLAAGAGSAPARRGKNTATIPRARWPARAGGAIVIVGAVAGVGAIGASYVANRDVVLASTTWPADPETAFRRLDRASALTPSARPSVVRGVIALRLEDRPRARRAFQDAARREPGDWFPPFQLGLLAAEEGDFRGARMLLARAAFRNPKDPVLRTARQSVARGKPFTAEAEQMIRERSRRRFGGPASIKR